MRVRLPLGLTVLLGAVAAFPSPAGADPGDEPDTRAPEIVGLGVENNRTLVRGRTFYRPIAEDDVGVVRFELVVDETVIADDDAPRDHTLGDRVKGAQARTLEWDTAGRNGSATVSVRAYDAAGNMGERVIPTTVDNIAPALSMALRSHNGFISGVVPVTFTGDSTVEALSVPVVDRFLNPAGPGPWTFVIDTRTRHLPEIEIGAVARDAAGNHRGVHKGFGIDNDPPTLTVRGLPANGTPVRNPQTYDVQTFDMNEVLVQLFQNSSATDYGRVPDRQTGRTRLTWYPGGRHGPVKITVRATDWFGQRREIVRTLIADQRPPSVSISSAPKHKAKVKGKIKIAAKASDQYGVARVELLVNGKVVGRDTKAGYSFTVDTAKQRKTMKIQVRAYDRAGNVAYVRSRTWHRR